MAQSKKKPNDRNDYKKILASLVKREREIYEEAGIGRRFVLLFPSKKIPLFGKVGVWLVRKAGGFIDVQYSLKK